MIEAFELGLPAHAFERQDDGDDLGFYAPPRLLKHIDEAAVGALTSVYRDSIPPGGRVLDLMSSWVSNLPDGACPVAGHLFNISTKPNSRSLSTPWGSDRCLFPMIER
ncbi:hypothetical protein C8J46_10658 [Sphingomonas sp. PP-F2F-A104-K0414]|uniref:hypothetical protein n=1 Tax=Sphingomonas sp. PP-F2F-A104-K0414 TaxID=2135661 RepID=UPI0010480A9B|nr:hypothetical protein [Sphingomonas sp. PP-F2F-A104-K0414]TCP97436.1 hypothetical protein C8J46_10658 [Sphingomonas sp. PP-F2F-A104-K0414]